MRQATGTILAAALVCISLVGCVPGGTDQVVYQFQADPSEIAFTELVPAPKTVTLRNIGITDATIDLAIGGTHPFSFKVDGVNCIGQKIAAHDGTCSFTVVPAPNAVSNVDKAEIIVKVGDEEVLSIPVAYTPVIR